MTLWLRDDLDAIGKLKTQPLVLFFDDGGVLNDNRLRGPEWVRLIGEFMPPRIGGTAEEWADTNPVVIREVLGDLQKRLPDFTSHREFQRTYAVNWMRSMCAGVGVSPVADEEAERLLRELSIYVGERATCAIAGATDAVRALHQTGYTLYTASGTPSWELQAILGNMGIRDLFSGLYGPDLIDHVKYGPGFYRRIFDDAGVSLSRTLVIESDLETCRWASDAGANAVWIDYDQRGDPTTLERLVQALI